MNAPGKCERVESLLSAFLDGELGHSDRLLVARHCGRCPSCDAQMQGLRRVKQDVARLRSAPADELLLHRLRARVSDDRSRSVRQAMAVGTVAAFAAVSLALVVASLTAAPPSRPVASDTAQAESSADQAYVVGMDSYALPSRAATVSLRR